MANNNCIKVYIALREEQIFVSSDKEFDDDLSHLSGEQFWDSMVVPLVAHAKQEFIKNYEIETKPGAKLKRG